MEQKRAIVEQLRLAFEAEILIRKCEEWKQNFFQFSFPDQNQNFI